MGEAAALSFYMENKDWLDGPDGAYDVLYGGVRKKKDKNRSKPRCGKCPICQKKLKSEKGVIDHMQMSHSLTREAAHNYLFQPTNRKKQR